MQPRTFSIGQKLINEGDRSEFLYLIRKGECLLVSQAQLAPNNKKTIQKEAM